MDDEHAQEMIRSTGSPNGPNEDRRAERGEHRVRTGTPQLTGIPHLAAVVLLTRSSRNHP